MLCATQFALAVRVLTRPSARLVEVTAIISGAVILLWIVTRSVALPFGLDGVEPVGFLDALSSAAEIVAIGGCVAWLRAARADVPRPIPRLTTAGG